MERTQEEIARAELADVDQRPSFHTSIRELRDAIVKTCRLVDDLEERLSDLERRDASR